MSQEPNRDPLPSPDRVEILVQGMPWAWDLAQGNVDLFGLPSVAFWTRPSLQRLLGPLREEVGDDLYRLLVAHYSSLGTEEDYQTMITELGSSFEQGFLAWGEAVSTAGWGRFFLTEFDPQNRVAVVRVDNPWELQIQGPDEDWGCPFLQGKLIGIFTQAFGVTCWAFEQNPRRDPQGCSIEFRIERSERTIAVELDNLRAEHQRARDGVLASEVERKTAALREAQVRQRAVLSSLSDLVFTVDRDLVIEQYLPPREGASSFPSADGVRGRPLVDVFGASMADTLRRASESLTTHSSKAAPTSVEFSHRVAGGRRRYDARFSSRAGDAGEIEGFTVIIRDVTRQREIEGQLRQSAKMDSIGQLAGGVAHDFNNLLTAIMSAADLLGMQVPAELKPLVEIVVDASETAGGVIQRLLDFSRRGLTVEIPVDVHDVIETAVSLVERSIDRRIDVRTRLEATAPTLRGDPTQLQSALLNLGVNARDAMPDGGELCFTTRNFSLDADYCASAAVELEPGLYVEISVSDTGEGMTDEVRARVFEPFFTTKSHGKGTGLGLPSVYGAVAEHRGEILIESEPGVGTTFRLRLPLGEAAVPAG